MMKIHPIQTGWVQLKPKHVQGRFGPRALRALDVVRDRTWSPRLPIGCWAIEHPEGLIVVDTGESSHGNDPGYAPSWHLFMRFAGRSGVAPEEEVGPQLQRLGLEPESVRWLVMTHMHSDHAGGIGWFQGAEVLMSETEAKLAFARTGPVNGFLNMHYPAWLDPTLVTFNDGPLESFAASHALTADGRVRLVPTPGHTKGHLSVIVDRGEDLVLIAGDAAYSEHTLLAGTVDGIAEDARAHRDSTHRLRELCRRRPVVTQFAHDPNSAARLSSNARTRPISKDDLRRSEHAEDQGRGNRVSRV
jgi:glyoxylase-like metal-dependent hydrolase (beta-lactamase superfamily II)